MENLTVIYVRNKHITPSSYYRIIQYSNKFTGNIKIREIAPDFIYKKQLNKRRNKIEGYIIGALYYLIMIFRVLNFLIIDNISIPKYVIVSKTFCPKYTPVIIRILIKKLSQKSILYWDFDDHIFIKNEISDSQARILKKESEKIIVTNEYLKSKIEKEYHDKIILLPTTDGDLQGFNEEHLLLKRMSTFEEKVNLVWVGTSVNLPNILKIIDKLDKAAEKIEKDQNKKLILTIVCNEKLQVSVNKLQIRNISWSRDVAKKEMYNAHIGIMPLVLNEYSLGKGGFKIIQYISTGLPVIASKVGFNKEIVNENFGVLIDDEYDGDEWIDVIINMSSSKDVWKNYSYNAYKRWKENFSFNYNLGVWKKLLEMT